MDDSTLDTMLRRTAPAVTHDDSAVEATVLAMTGDAERRARPIRRRRRALWVAAIPVVPVMALGLTAGIQDRLAPDLIIPVSYTTDTGVTENCEIDVFNGEEYWVEVSFTAVDYLSKQNWDGIGQRIYTLALTKEAAITQQAAAGDISVSVDGVNMPTPAQIQQQAWNLAAGDLTDGIVPAEPGDHWGGDSDCSGQLH